MRRVLIVSAMAACGGSSALAPAQEAYGTCERAQRQFQSCLAGHTPLDPGELPVLGHGNGPIDTCARSRETVAMYDGCLDEAGCVGFAGCVDRAFAEAFRGERR